MRKPGPSSRRLSASRRKTASRRELTTKRRGELAELAFTLKAASLGFGVAKPYGDSERYDFILDAREIGNANVGTGCSKTSCHSERRRSFASRTIVTVEEPASPRPLLHRVQVKCSTQLLEGLYRVNAHRRTNVGAVPYLPSEIDFLAAHIIPEDTWYIIPVHAIRGTSLLFRRKGDRKPGMYDQYREAWHLLRKAPS